MRGEVVGVIFVFRAYAGQSTTNDRIVLQSFADQAAIAVHNARLYQNVNHEKQRLAAILDHSADGVIILDASLHIVQVNIALGRITGWLPAKEMRAVLDGLLRTALDQPEKALEDVNAASCE